MAEPGDLKYRAFLSYAHADTAVARRLHRALEGFKLGGELVGRATALGPVPQSLYPIFRDREDFAGGHALTDATVAALDQSAALIVVCSTASATRPAVNEEVRLFRFRHPERPVIPVIVDGAYPDNFPPALRFALGPQGQITGEPITILGPDIRKEADGWDAALSKIVAGLTGLSPNEIFDRLKRNQRAAARTRAAIAAAMIALAGAGGFYFYDAQRKGQTIVTHQQERSEALAIARQLLGASPAQAAMPGAEDSLVATLTAIQKNAAAGDADYKKAFELLKAGKGAEAVPLLLAAAEEKQKRSAKEGKEAAEAFRQAAAIAAVAEPWRARDLYAKAAALDPDNIEGSYRHGHYQEEAGQLAAAETAFRRVIATGKANVDDGNLYWARLGLGDIQMARGNLSAALTTYKEAQGVADANAKSDAGNAGWQRDLSVSHSKIGDVLVAQGNLAEALRSYQALLGISEQLAKSDAGNAGWQRDLSVSHNKVGDVLVAQGNLAEALRSYQASHGIREQLAKSDAGNAEWQRDLSVSHTRIGDVLVAQGNLAEALRSYQAAHGIAEQLAKSDAGNAGWQRDLSVSYNKIGDVLRAQGNVAEALRSYQASLGIAEQLVKSDEGNAGWRRDLSVSNNKIGDVLVGQGNLAEALRSYQAAHGIREQLAKSDVGNAAWQRDVAVSNERIGDIAIKQSDETLARTSFESALRAYDQLVARNPDDVPSLVNSVVPRLRLASLDPPNARKHLAAALEILKSLAAENRLDANRTTWIPEIEAQLAALDGTKTP